MLKSARNLTSNRFVSQYFHPLTLSDPRKPCNFLRKEDDVQGEKLQPSKNQADDADCEPCMQDRLSASAPSTGIASSPLPHVVAAPP